MFHTCFFLRDFLKALFIERHHLMHVSSTQMLVHHMLMVFQRGVLFICQQSRCSVTKQHLLFLEHTVSLQLVLCLIQRQHRLIAMPPCLAFRLLRTAIQHEDLAALQQH